MNINIRTIPSKAQRYRTIGDWWFDLEGNLEVRVSAMGNSRYEFLVGLHEAVEAMICDARGISEFDITAFDNVFEGERAEGKHEDHDEPGHDPRAPYRQEHSFAEGVERLVAVELDVNWKDYDEFVEKVYLD